MDKNWVIVAAVHDQEGSNELWSFLKHYGAREFMMGDKLRGFYDAMGLDTLRSAAWHNGIYVGPIKDVLAWFEVYNDLNKEYGMDDQEELDFD